MRTGFSGHYYLQFERIGQDEAIPQSAFHSLDEGESLAPLANPSSVGQTPKQFDKARSFWRVVTIKNLPDNN